MAISVKSQQIVDDAAVSAALVGAPGALFAPLDLGGMGIIWYRLVRDLGKVSGHSMGWRYAGKLVLGLSTSAALYIGGSKLITNVIGWLGGVATVPAMALNSSFNYVYTKRLGRMVAEQFEQPGFHPRMLMASGLAAAGLFDLPSPDDVETALFALGDAVGMDPDDVKSAVGLFERALEAVGIQHEELAVEAGMGGPANGVEMADALPDGAEASGMVEAHSAPGAVANAAAGLRFEGLGESGSLSPLHAPSLEDTLRTYRAIAEQKGIASLVEGINNALLGTVDQQIAMEAQAVDTLGLVEVVKVGPKVRFSGPAGMG